jgi:hypothetical protein
LDSPVFVVIRRTSVNRTLQQALSAVNPSSWPRLSRSWELRQLRRSVYSIAFLRGAAPELTDTSGDAATAISTFTGTTLKNEIPHKDHAFIDGDIVRGLV